MSIHVFFDNSNIWGGAQAVRNLTEPGVPWPALHLPSQFLGKPHQPMLLLGGDGDAFRQLAAEDFVLDLQVFDLAGQLFLGRAGEAPSKVARVLTCDGRLLAARLANSRRDFSR